MNSIRRFRYIKPIYKKSIIINQNVYKKQNSNLLKNDLDLNLSNNQDSNLINNNLDSNLVIYKKPSCDLVVYKVNNKLCNYKSNKYLNIYILFKIAYFINLI